jgi:hypothetical protein
VCVVTFHCSANRIINSSEWELNSFIHFSFLWDVSANDTSFSSFPLWYAYWNSTFWSVSTHNHIRVDIQLLCFVFCELYFEMKLILCVQRFLISMTGRIDLEDGHIRSWNNTPIEVPFVCLWMLIGLSPSNQSIFFFLVSRVIFSDKSLSLSRFFLGCLTINLTKDKKFSKSMMI